MKKIFKLFALILLFGFLVGCSNNSGSDSSSGNEQPSNLAEDSSAPIPESTDVSNNTTEDEQSGALTEDPSAAASEPVEVSDGTTEDASEASDETTPSGSASEI
ncbi:MAG: hypothetical protein LBD84_06660 [Campylobacteraceae bacterium]|jgi:hypothetical protein|nr:hypothetical protein [Campylobacteraceae bacterium]